MSYLIAHWDGFFDVVTLLVAIIGALSTTGLLVRRKRTMKELIYVEQERDDLRQKNALQFVRLNNVDPERFLDKADDLTSKADFSGLEDAAVSFTNAQSEAFGRAAEILAEQRILDSEAHGKGAAEEAIRFARIGIAANPGSKRLIELEKMAQRRSCDIEQGEPIDTLGWEGMSDVGLNHLSTVLLKKGSYQLAEIAARRSVPLAIIRTGPGSENYAAAIGLHATTLNKLGANEEAESLYRASLILFEEALGVKHPNTVIARENLEIFLATRPN